MRVKTEVTKEAPAKDIFKVKVQSKNSNGHHDDDQIHVDVDNDYEDQPHVDVDDHDNQFHIDQVDDHKEDELDLCYRHAEVGEAGEDAWKHQSKKCCPAISFGAKKIG